MAEAKRRNLGRGLAALLGEESAKSQEGAASAPVEAGPSAAPAAAVAQGTRKLAVTDLHPSPYQPRQRFEPEALDSLAASVKEQGILQPILVRPSRQTPGRYEIVAGERRWRAAQRASLHEVPVLVRELDDEDVLEVAIVENVQRQDLNALEEAEGYQRLIDEFGHSAEEVGRLVGKSRSHVANTLRLLKLPPKIQDYLREGDISAGHARALLGAADPEALAREIIAKGLSVREAERRAQAPKRKAVGGKSAAPVKDRDTLILEETLANKLGLKVEIQAKGEAGRVVIHYDSLEQLDDIVARLDK